MAGEMSQSVKCSLHRHGNAWLTSGTLAMGVHACNNPSVGRAETSRSSEPAGGQPSPLTESQVLWRRASLIQKLDGDSRTSP